MIQRFEDEFPETRIAQPPIDPNSPTSPVDELLSDTSLNTSVTTIRPAPLPSSPVEEEDDSSGTFLIPDSISRRASSTSLASRQAQEEGRVHRFGQRLRREIIRPQVEDHSVGTTGNEVEPEHLQKLRERLENINSDEWKAELEKVGPEAILEKLKLERLKYEKEAGDVDGQGNESLEEWRRRMMERK